MLELHFMVKQQNLDRLHDVLLEVSMPNSPSYGKHLSNEAVNEMTRPRDEDIAALQAYVPSAVAATPNKDMFTATMTIREAELLLNAQYEILRHTATDISSTAVARTACPPPMHRPSTSSPHGAHPGCAQRQQVEEVAGR